MSESIPAYVRCAAGANAFVDCLVESHGDLVRLIGHPTMDFARDDARALARAILERIGEFDGEQNA